MLFENLFSLAGIIAISGWLLLLLSPWIPESSDRIAGCFLPLLLSLGYVLLVVVPGSDGGGGFGTLDEVMSLFSREQAALAGWIHFLAFDLFIGAWVCRKARSEGMAFRLVAPCLAVIFLLGPAGFLAFQSIRAMRGKPTLPGNC